MSDTLERIRRQLDLVIEEAAVAIEADRALAAHAIELATSTLPTAQAYEAGRRDERTRILSLIEEQLSSLSKAGINAISLATLSRTITAE
jgi:hypothetical protein